MHDVTRADGLALPHVFSFASIIGGASQTYWHTRFDEAMRHARENALAMRRDCFLMSLLDERKRAVSSLPWYLEVPDPRDPVQAFVRAQLTQSLRGLRGFRRMILQWLEAIWFGRSAVQFEWCWEELDGRRALAVKQWAPVQGDKIGYHWDGCPYVLYNSSRTTEMPGAERVNTTVASALRLYGGWRERFVIHQHQIEDADFFEGEAADARHGVGIRSYVYWLDYLKREYLDWVVTYLERVGLGTTLWKYDASDPDAKSKAEEAAKENSRRTNITVPVWPDSKGGMVGGVERIEAPTGGVEVLRSMIEALDHYIERYVIGQAGSARGQAAGMGNEAAHEFMSNTKDAIRDHDAHMLGETITGDARNPGIVSLMQRYTFPETLPGRPNGFPVLFKFGLERSLNNQRVQTIMLLLNQGLPVKKDDLYNAAGISRPEPHDDIILPPQLMAPPANDGGANKGKPDDKEKEKPKPGPGGDKGKPQHHARKGRPVMHADEPEEESSGFDYPEGEDESSGFDYPEGEDESSGFDYPEGEDEAGGILLSPLDDVRSEPFYDDAGNWVGDAMLDDDQKHTGDVIYRGLYSVPAVGPDGKVHHFAADEPDPDDLLSDEEFVPDPESGDEEYRRLVPAPRTPRRRQAGLASGSLYDEQARVGDRGSSDLHKSHLDATGLDAESAASAAMDYEQRLDQDGLPLGYDEPQQNAREQPRKKPRRR